MKKIIGFVFATASLLSLNSCEYGLDYINPAGDTKAVERAITGKITKIAIHDDVKVTIHFTDGRQYATVKAGENIIRDVKTDVSDTTLTIRNNSSIGWSSSYKNKKEVTLYLNESVSTLAYFGVQDVLFVDTIRTKSFSYRCDESAGRVTLPLIASSCDIVQHSGVSDLTIGGKCANVTVYYKGSGWIYLQDFQTQNAVATSNGSGDIFLNVSNSLSATIMSIGNIIYKGQPQISVTKDGKGSLKPTK